VHALRFDEARRRARAAPRPLRSTSGVPRPTRCSDLVGSRSEDAGRGSISCRKNCAHGLAGSGPSAGCRSARRRAGTESRRARRRTRSSHRCASAPMYCTMPNQCRPVSAGRVRIDAGIQREIDVVDRGSGSDRRSRSALLPRREWPGC
jgi:hypothetical protein